MSRTANTLYIVVFAGMLLALSLWSMRGIVGFSVAKETTVLNGKLAHAFEKHYDDQFPIKQIGTNLWALVDFGLFGEGRQGVVIGKDGWLFSDEEFDPVADGNRHLQENLALVQGVRDELANRGVTLVLAIVPSKSRLYPEYTGDARPTALRQDLYAQFRGAARKAGIIAPDLLGTLEQAKSNGQVFLRTDTHWTPLGAEVVANTLGETVRSAAPLSGDAQEYVTEAVKNEDYKGDLTRFLPLDPMFENLMPAPTNCRNARPGPRSKVRPAATPCSPTAPSRWCWWAPATAPTRTGTSPVRCASRCNATWSTTPRMATARSCRCSSTSRATS